MELSIIIVGFQVRDHLRSCLTSIFWNSPGAEFEILWMNNGSRDGTADILRERLRTMKGIVRPDNWGCNQDLQDGVTTFLLFLARIGIFLASILLHNQKAFYSHPSGLR